MNSPGIHSIPPVPGFIAKSLGGGGLSSINEQTKPGNTSLPRHDSIHIANPIGYSRGIGNAAVTRTEKVADVRVEYTFNPAQNRFDAVIRDVVSGEVIRQIPSESSRKVSSLIDQLISLGANNRKKNDSIQTLNTTV